MDDLVQWAQVPGVGAGRGEDLVPAAPTSPLPTERVMKKPRHRPNNGRTKRTDRHPLPNPPWDILRELEVYIPPTIANLPTTPINWRVGPRANAWRKAVRVMWGSVCHLCGHEGAYTADHLVPLSVWSNQPYDPHLSRPAHGVDGCPTCHIKCNSSRGNKALAIQIGHYKPPIEL